MCFISRRRLRRIKTPTISQAGCPITVIVSFKVTSLRSESRPADFPLSLSLSLCSVIPGREHYPWNFIHSLSFFLSSTLYLISLRGEKEGKEARVNPWKLKYQLDRRCCSFYEAEGSLLSIEFSCLCKEFIILLIILHLIITRERELNFTEALKTSLVTGEHFKSRNFPINIKPSKLQLLHHRSPAS